MAENPYDMSSSQELAATEASDAGADTPAKSSLSGRRRRREYGSSAMRGNILVVAFLVAAGVLIYGLGQRGGPMVASAEQQQLTAKVDSTIIRLSNDPQFSLSGPRAGRISQEVLQRFYNGISQHQVLLEDLSKNPFQFVPPPQAQVLLLPSQVSQGSGQQPPEPGGTTREDMVERLKDMRLQAIQRSGGRATAIISNNLVVEGQALEGFTVKSIRPKEVLLSWKGEEFVLNMQ